MRITKNYLKDGDSLIWFNFRPDRARQIIKSLSEETFSDFERKFFPKLNLVTFTQYDANLQVKVEDNYTPNDICNQVSVMFPNYAVLMSNYKIRDKKGEEGKIDGMMILISKTAYKRIVPEIFDKW